MNPTPSLNENCLWIPETSDNVVPGLDSMITYIQSKYATATTLQNAITNINNNIQTEINNLETPNQGSFNVKKKYITTQPIQIIHFNEITQYTNVIIVGRIFYSKTTLHISGKVIKS